MRLQSTSTAPGRSAVRRRLDRPLQHAAGNPLASLTTTTRDSDAKDSSDSGGGSPWPSRASTQMRPPCCIQCQRRPAWTTSRNGSRLLRRVDPPSLLERHSVSSCVPHLSSEGQDRAKWRRACVHRWRFPALWVCRLQVTRVPYYSRHGTTRGHYCPTCGTHGWPRNARCLLHGHRRVPERTPHPANLIPLLQRQTGAGLAPLPPCGGRSAGCPEESPPFTVEAFVGG